MISLQNAVDGVRAHLAGFTDLMQTTDLRLEEFDYDDRAGEWIVTVSFLDQGFPGIAGNRVYKTLYVNGNTRTVKAMKMRNPYAPA